MIKSWLSVFSITLTMISCQTPDANITAAEKDYPDVPNSIRQAIQNNLKEEMTLLKIVNTQGTLEEQTFDTDSIIFYQDMSLLLQYDLNKPAYRGVFEIEKVSAANGNEIITLTAKESESPNIISAQFTSRNQSLTHARWIVKDKNYVYHSERIFDITFAESNNHIILEKYQITVGQKIIAQDSVWYTINAQFSKK